MTDAKKKPQPPPNKPRPAAPGKPGNATKPPAPVPGAAKKPDIITGNMKVEITIKDVHITVEGPIIQVVAVLNWIFGSKEPSKVIASLQLVFGPEVGMKIVK